MAIPRQPDCIVRGTRVEIRPLRFDDLPEMRAWQPHEDLLLQDYNLSYETEAEWQSWLRSRLRHRWVYAIRNHNGALIGHLSLRQLDVPHSSRLGFSLGAQYVGQGYGRDAMEAFLTYYFDVLNLKEMRLDVSGANRRARHLYEKLSFGTVGSFWREAHWGATPTPETRRYFRWGQVRFFEMRLSATEWRQIRAARE